MGRVTLSTFDARSFAARLYERVRKAAEALTSPACVRRTVP
jgi:hypothetical protein